MKTFTKLFLLSLVLIIITSCSKEDEQSNSTLDNAILLEINPEYGCYVAENGDHFYYDALLSINDSNLYKLDVEAGKKYHFICTQPGLHYTNLQMLLLNSEMDTISISYRKEGIPHIYFEPSSNDYLYLTVSTGYEYNESLSYNLYFEVFDPVSTDFNGYPVEYYGPWQITGANSLKFTKIDTRGFRWFRFNTSLDNPDVSFTLKATQNSDIPSFGFLFDGSTDLLTWSDYRYELPDFGTFFNILDNQTFRIYNIKGSSIGFDSGSYSVPDIDMINGVNINLLFHDYGSHYTYEIILNGTSIQELSIESINTFYLVTQDLDYGDILFENIQFESDTIAKK